MQENNIKIPEIKLVGIKARTSLAIEMTPDKSVISPTVMSYFHNGLAEKIQNRTKPGVTYCVYTEYESDYRGEYTYFIGEEVSSFDNIPDGLTKLSIPAQKYTKFTNGPGPMPSVCIDLWQKIWGMSEKELGGQREYISDFEIYDERAADHNNVILDVYVGIK
jgi:predicted transcriptional regulator YdeE